jgi:hypothetical protein
MNEVADVLISVNLLFIVRNWNVFWFILINTFSPGLFVTLDSIWQLLEEESVFIGEFMLGKCL